MTLFWLPSDSIVLKFSAFEKTIYLTFLCLQLLRTFFDKGAFIW